MFVSGMKITQEFVQQALQVFEDADTAHHRVMSYARISASEARRLNPPPRESAVLMVLYPKGLEIYTCLLARQEYAGVHSGQVSFPGGKKENTDDDLLATALRETEEEVGIQVMRTQIIGSLSELYIPPSRFVVQPYVAWLEAAPQWMPDAREVQEVLECALSDLLAPDALSEREVFIPVLNKSLMTPTFSVAGRTVWGATAMMLEEFRSALHAGNSRYF
jgi:8-oxo-dGTP pyrophosphatase MutT (NUDIX family)